MPSHARLAVLALTACLGAAVLAACASEATCSDVALSAEAASALDALPGGLEAFGALTEAQRDGMVAFLERARTAETRARYVARVVGEVRRRLGE